MRKIALTVVVAVLALAGCQPTDSADPNITATPPAAAGSSKAKAAKPKTTRTVTYKVGGTADSALVTYETPSGQEQQNGADVPWKKSFKVKKHDFSMLAVTAQNSGGGTITCEIDVDGKPMKRSKSSGAYAVVSCNATLGF